MNGDKADNHQITVCQHHQTPTGVTHWYDQTRQSVAIGWCLSVQCEVTFTEQWKPRVRAGGVFVNPVWKQQSLAPLVMHKIHISLLKSWRLSEFNYDLYPQRLLKGYDCKDLKKRLPPWWEFRKGEGAQRTSMFNVGNLRRISRKDHSQRRTSKAINTANSRRKITAFDWIKEWLSVSFL